MPYPHQAVPASVQSLGHVRPVEAVPEPAVVVTRADAGDDGQLRGAVLLARDSLGLLHQQRAETLRIRRAERREWYG